MSEEKREVAVPGEIIKSGKDYLPGEGTRKVGDDITASRFGLVEESGRFLRVIPLSGIYMPRRGNLVIGRVTDIAFNGWMMDINSPYSAFLLASEGPRYVNKNDLSEQFAIGDLIACKVLSMKRRGVDLTTRGRGLDRLEGGMIMKINSNKVPRVIGKAGSMIQMIKDATKCNITVGQNGVIWIRGEEVEDELAAKEAIQFVVDKSFINGLTEEVSKYLEKNVKKENKVEKTQE